MDARATAAVVLARVLAGKVPLDVALDENMDACLSATDKSLVQELCYGVSRWYYRLDYCLRYFLQQPVKGRDIDIKALLLLGLYQFEYTRIPDHATVSATVQAARELGKPWSCKLINAVLRRYQREKQSLHERLAKNLAASVSFPAWMLRRFRADWPDHWQALITASNEKPPMHLRINPARTDRSAYISELRQQGLQAQATKIVETGVSLARAVAVDRLPGFAQGRVSVQDVASQLAAPLLDVAPGQAVLDACAAPGGKTAHILESTGGLARVDAVEISEDRLRKLQKTLDRIGVSARLICADAAQPGEWWDGRHYDRILLDAPCSGTGVIRRHPDIKILRSERHLLQLERTQRRLLTSLWQLLAPGGRILYATCSLLQQENDHQIERFLETRQDVRLVAIEANWGKTTAYGRQLLCGNDDTDGFYYALLEKL